MPSTIAIVISIIAVVFLAALFISEAMHGNLNIKARTVGDGQYGTARWATKREEQETYDEVLYEPKMWRAGKHLPDEPNGAAVLGILEGRGEVRARIDSSDSHTLILSTTGGRKTTGFLYPNLEFICACGCSFLATDTKGDVFRDYAGIAHDGFCGDLCVPLCPGLAGDVSGFFKEICVFVDQMQKVESVAARGIPPVEWARSNHIQIGDYVYLVATTEGIIICPAGVKFLCVKEEKNR